MNDRAARRVLDSPKSSLIHRQNAERTLRKGAQRRHEIYPTIYGLDGERASASATPADTEPEHCGFVATVDYSNRVTLKARQAYKEEYEQWHAKTSAEPMRKNGPNSDEKIPRSINVNYKPTTRQKENVSKVWLALTTAGKSLTATDKGLENVEHPYQRMTMALSSLRRCRRKHGTSSPKNSPVFAAKMLTRAPLPLSSSLTAPRRIG